MQYDLMIDIETMGTSHDAAMIQLAAVFFNPKTGELGSEFCASLSLNDCLDNGFKQDPRTVEWWKQQDPAVLAAIIEAERPCKEVMQEFANFLGPYRNSLKVWSHATFDFVIVQNYLKHFTRSWMNHKFARDIRTLVDLSGINLGRYDWNKKTHNALDDCKFQVQYCVDALGLLNSRILPGTA